MYIRGVAWGGVKIRTAGMKKGNMTRYNYLLLFSLNY